MGKRKHRSRSSDDTKRKRSRSSSSSTSSSSDTEPDVKDSRRNIAEDVVSDSEKQLVSSKEKKTHKHKKRCKSTESDERKEKKKKKKMKKEHRKHKSKKSHRHSSPECFGPVPPASSSAEISKSKKSELGEVEPGDQRVMAPMTKEQWEKQRNTIRHVYDPETGRNRLVRGNGEILEEIVSKKRHAEINKRATLGDGIFYQLKAGLAKKPNTK